MARLRSFCYVEGCGKPCAGAGLCDTHYRRWKKHGDPLASLYQTNKGHECGVDGCELPAIKRGWCNTHYARYDRQGDPNTVLHIHGDDTRRFWSYVNKTDTCWLWTGALDFGGYGKFQLNYSVVRAHRFAYELVVGPIPEGLQIDHVYSRGCRYRNCVNPAHLEPVTTQENTRRMSAAQQDKKKSPE